MNPAVLVSQQSVLISHGSVLVADQPAVVTPPLIPPNPPPPVPPPLPTDTFVAFGDYDYEAFMSQFFQPPPSDAGPAQTFFAITPSDLDSANFTFPVRAIYVGAPGDIVAVNQSNAPVLIKNVPDGTILPIKCVRVNQTGTTALNLVGLC